MGLLDNISGLMNDPQGLLGINLLAAAGPSATPSSFGQRLLSGLMSAQAQQQAVEDRKQKQAMQDLQSLLLKAQIGSTETQTKQHQAALDEQQRQRDFLQTLPSPQMLAGQQALAGGGGPTTANAAKVPAVSPMQQFMFEGVRGGALPLQSYIASMQKDTTPIKVGAGDSLVDPSTMRALFTAPQKDEKPNRVKEYEYARAQGYPGTYQQFVLEQKRAGATNVSVNTEKSLLGEMAQGLGKQLDAGLADARTALSSIANAQTLQKVAQSGNLMAGPGANFGVLGLQIGQMLGVNGQNAKEKLLNTREAIQTMAKSELEAASMMRGQGQITESEREILRRATSGDINSMTAPEIDLLGKTMEKTARLRIQQHQQRVQQLSKMPNAGPLMPFYGVNEPPASIPGAGGGWSIRPLGN